MEKIVDTQLSQSFKLRALQKYGAAQADFLAERAAEDLADRLATLGRTFEDGIALFNLTGHAANALRQSGKLARIERVETNQAFLGEDEGRISDPEILELEGKSADLIASLLTLHEVNDLPGMLVQIRNSLRPDGLFLGAMAGAGTLAELRQSLLEAESEISGGASPHIMPFADIRDVGALLQRAGFALPVTDLEEITVRYDSIFGLIRDLRAMGAGNALLARSRKPLSRRVLIRAAEIYAEKFADADGRLRATFSIIWMSGWAPHAMQPKPARPGSATKSLADALREQVIKDE